MVSTSKFKKTKLSKRDWMSIRLKIINVVFYCLRKPRLKHSEKTGSIKLNLCEPVFLVKLLLLARLK